MLQDKIGIIAIFYCFVKQILRQPSGVPVSLYGNIRPSEPHSDGLIISGVRSIGTVNLNDAYAPNTFKRSSTGTTDFSPAGAAMPPITICARSFQLAGKLYSWAMAASGSGL